MSSVPLKLKDSAAPTELQQMSATEENYLAYQVGLGFAALDSSDVNALGVYPIGTYDTVGSLINTSYDSAVGTHSNLLTISTSQIDIKQRTGTASTSGSDYRIPVSMRDSDGQTIIDEMDSDKLTPLLDRIGSRIYTSDYPGTYKLATAAPSGDYSLTHADVMTDSRVDGHQVTYNLYRRSTMTAPTTVRPFSVKRSGGATGTYLGLQVMTDNQIKYSLGVKLRNRISSTSDTVGTYKILSSATGTPTDAGFTGTWQAKGTATDTRQVVSDVNYTRDRTSTYSRSRTSTYSAEYARTRNSNYLGNYSRTRSSTYIGDYITNRESTYSPSFVGDYIADYFRTRIQTGASQANFNRILDFDRNSTTSYLGDYNRTVGYSRNFYRSAAYNYPPRLQKTTWRYVLEGYSRSYYRTVSYDRNRAATFLGDYNRTVTSTAYYTGDYLGDYTRTILKEGAGAYSRDFTGNFTGDFISDSEGNFTRTVVSGNFSRNFVGDFMGNYMGDFISDFLGDYSRQVGYTSQSQAFRYTYANKDGQWYYYTGATYTGTGSFEGNYFRNTQYDDQVNRTANYSRSFEGSGLENYLGDFSQNVTQDFIGVRSSNFAGDLQFSRQFAGNFLGEYSRDFNATFAGDYTRNFEGNYTGNYSRDFLGNYARTFAGNYAGATITSGTTNIQTYTMYVRVA